MSRLDEIEARYKGASAGPWSVLDEREIEFNSGPGSLLVVCPEQDGDPITIVADLDEGRAASWHDKTTDAEFIAHGRQDIPDLVTFARTVQRILREGESFPQAYADDLNEIEEALNQLNGEQP